MKHHKFGAFLKAVLPRKNPYLPKNDDATPPGLPAALPTAITPAIYRSASEDLKDSAKNLDSSMFDYTLEETTLPDTNTAKKHGNRPHYLQYKYQHEKFC
jgi:hypothetical protein